MANLDSFEANMSRVKIELQDLMRSQGLNSLDDIFQDAEQAFSDAEEAKTFSDKISEIKKTESEDEYIAAVYSYVGRRLSRTSTFVEYSVSLSRGGILVVATAMAAQSIRYSLKGGENISKALKLLKASGSLAHYLDVSKMRTIKLVKVFGYVSKVTSVLKYIGIVVDVTMGILAAIEGKKQREVLQENIRNLFERRIVLSYLTTLMLEFASTIGSIESFLRIEKAKDGSSTDAWLQTLLDKMVPNFASDLETTLESITYRTEASTWTNLDSNRSSWTNEDPNLEEILGKLEQASSIPESASESQAAYLDANSATVPIPKLIEMKPNDVTYIEQIFDVPTVISYHVTALKSGTQFIGGFTYNKKRDENSDAITWFLSTYSDVFTFRLKLFQQSPVVTKHRSGFHLPLNEPVRIMCKIGSTEATYHVNNEKYATATYSGDQVAERGYFCFNTYGDSEAVVTNIAVY